MQSHPPSPPSTSSFNIYFFILIATFLLILVIAVLLLYSCRCEAVSSLRRCLRCGIRRGQSAEDVIPIPVCRYREEQSFSSECSVCLTEFHEGEKVRQLPTCRHSFHAPCVDMWLFSHSSCPTCRALVPQVSEGLQRTESMENESQQRQQMMESRGGAVVIESD